MLSFLYPVTALLLPSLALLASADELARPALVPLRRTPASGVIGALLHVPFGKSDKLQRIAARATCPIGYHACTDVDGCCVIGEYCAFVGGVHGCCPNGSTCTVNDDDCEDPGYIPCSGDESVCCPIGGKCYQDDFGNTKCRGGSTGGGNTVTTTKRTTTSIAFTTSTTESFSFNIPSVTTPPVIPTTVVTVTAPPTTTGSGGGFTLGGANAPSPTNAATSVSGSSGMGMLSVSVVLGVLFSFA